MIDTWTCTRDLNTNSLSLYVYLKIWKLLTQLYLWLCWHPGVTNFYTNPSIDWNLLWSDLRTDVRFYSKEPKLNIIWNLVWVCKCVYFFSGKLRLGFKSASSYSRNGVFCVSMRINVYNIYVSSTWRLVIGRVSNVWDCRISSRITGNWP
jgi:hypothetical protein